MSYMNKYIKSKYKGISENIHKVWLAPLLNVYATMSMEPPYCRTHLIVTTSGINSHVRWGGGVPCPHSMARPQVADERPPAMEVSCEYIE
jgi:hypothetical protein